MSAKCLMKWPQEFKFWILKRFLVGVLGWCWWVCRCLGFESWACLSGFWKSGIFPYDKDSILNCHLNYAFESFWMITKWALIPCYEYIQGVQRSRKVSVRFWKFETAKVGMGVKLVKMTIHSFSFVLIFLSLGKVWEMFRWCLFHLRNILRAKKHTNKLVQKNFNLNAYTYSCFHNFN